ncbi:hypothetical protein [Congregicoccus parvus]|uniref:hypothetical protein n=1 Tax=Congregicoccus parvus TaxID=3081749 RepID=UPI003FA5B367
MVWLGLGPERASATESADQAPAPAPASDGASNGWWVRAGEREIRHEADGRRTFRHGDLVYDETKQESGGSITTSDGIRYRSTDSGTIELHVGGDGRKLRKESEEATGETGIERYWRAFGAWLSGTGATTESSEDAFSLARAGPWVFEAISLLLRVCAAMVVLRVICFWIEVSYSKSTVLRYAVVLTVVAESIVRWLPGELWAG